MPEEYDPVDVLEARVLALEKKVFGENGDNYDTSVNVVDSLLKSQTMTSTAVSSREKINTMVKRLDQLEVILDPTYEDNLIDQGARIELILMMEDELRETINRLTMLQEMKTVLESEHIRNIPKIQDRLDKLSVNLNESAEKTRQTSFKINNLVKCYNDILNGFTKTFAQLNELITNLEIEATPKKVYD